MIFSLRISLIFLAALLLSSCGAIPTLPPLDSTVAFKTPQYTGEPPSFTATSDPVLPTQTPTVRVESTSSPTKIPPSAVPSTSPTPSASQTSTVTPTRTSTPAPTPTRTPAAAPTSTAVPYRLQGADPYYLANFTRQDAGCSWLGVGGQVFSRKGQVQKNVVIKAGGTLNGKALLETVTMPLTEPEIDLAYGPGGYELTLANQAAASEGMIWIQLYNLGGYPLSDKIYLVTYDDCLKNLILVNFIEK